MSEDELNKFLGDKYSEYQKMAYAVGLKYLEEARGSELRAALLEKIPRFVETQADSMIEILKRRMNENFE